MTWASFPIGPNRTLVKDLKKKRVKVGSEIKVILEIDNKISQGEKSYILDHIGHTLLYLLKPRSSNECEDAQKFIRRNAISISGGN